MTAEKRPTNEHITIDDYEKTEKCSFHFTAQFRSVIK